SSGGLRRLRRRLSDLRGVQQTSLREPMQQFDHLTLVSEGFLGHGSHLLLQLDAPPTQRQALFDMGHGPPLRTQSPSLPHQRQHHREYEAGGNYDEKEESTKSPCHGESPGSAEWPISTVRLAGNAKSGFQSIRSTPRHPPEPICPGQLGSDPF